MNVRRLSGTNATVKGEGGVLVFVLQLLILFELFILGNKEFVQLFELPTEPE